MAARAMALLLPLIFYFAVSSGEEYSGAALSAHVDALLAEYDREAAPAAARVRLALRVRHAALDDGNMRLLADLHLNWMDPRLAWNASQWEGSSAVVAAERLWAPDVALASGAARDQDAWLRARVAADGGVALVRRLELAAPVALQLADWPRDTQHADFKFASRAHSLDELDLVVDEKKMNEGSVIVESGAWEVLSVAGSTETWQRADGTSARAAAWRVRTARRGAALAAQHGAVLAATTLLLAAAVLRPYPQRLPLAATATLVAALWLIAVSFVVPSASSTPRVVLVMCALCAAGACGGAAAALAHAVSRLDSPPPAALRALLARRAALHAVTHDAEGAAGGARRGAWAAAARLLDAALAALLALALLLIVAVHLLA